MNTGKWVEQNTHHKIGDMPYWISNQKGPRRNLDVKDRDLEIEKGQAGLPQTQQLYIYIYACMHACMLTSLSSLSTLAWLR